MKKIILSMILTTFFSIALFGQNIEDFEKDLPQFEGDEFEVVFCVGDIFVWLSDAEGEEKRHGEEGDEFLIVGGQLGRRLPVQSSHVMLQGQQDAEHLASELVVIEIGDKGNDVLVGTQAMSTFPSIVCGL